MNAGVTAYVKAQMDMGRVLKNAVNPHLKNRYADLSAVLEAVLPALHANGFCLMQPCGQDEYGPYVETTLIHSSGERFASKVYLLIGKQDMQAVGSAISYARRYGLLGMAGLAPEDDDGEATKSAPRQQPANHAPAGPSKADQAAAASMIAAIREHGEAAWNDPRLQADLAKLRVSSPELAAQVEAEIETKKQGKAA